MIDNDKLDQYIAGHIDPEPALLGEVYRSTYLHHLYPRMCSGHVQGRVLKMLTSMINPRRVLELGTFTGYATLSIAEALAPGAVIDTVEVDDEKEDELTERFGSSPFADRIRLTIGDALDVIPRVAADGPWDLVYIDANKRDYQAYFEAVIDNVRPGGFIIADNTLWDGKVLTADDPTTIRDAQTRAIAMFNDAIAADTRIEKIIIPIRDGLTIMRRREQL